MDTGHNRAAVIAGGVTSRDARPHAPASERSSWNPLTAWRLQSLYGAIVPALRAILAAGTGHGTGARPQISTEGLAMDRYVAGARNGRRTITLPVGATA